MKNEKLFESILREDDFDNENSFEDDQFDEQKQQVLDDMEEVENSLTNLEHSLRMMGHECSREIRLMIDRLTELRSKVEAY